MENIYEVLVYFDGELFVNLEYRNNRQIAILDYQALSKSTRTIMQVSQHNVGIVYLKRNGYTIAEIHFHKDFTGRVTYGKRYKNDYLPCDPLREVVKKWKQ